MYREYQINTHSRVEFIDITPQLENAVRESKIKDGLVFVYIPHTTAAVTINEHADPSVVSDIIKHLKNLVPENAEYSHFEGNSDAHIKASLIGTSVQVPLQGGRLMLGTWQGVFFCEFDGPRRRRFSVTIISC
ncbi:secondary thiamine-phosphate synthase enzyme YjbQ [Kosmotoga pacifica]|uniref:YjbQ family protein n=1 Tax=Kosmotoga pacifica TaxID=1330330 RepID=A0A0G2Z5X5_9BACT|nr:secondary thiamine-phosphate synthase enzyme YjbQ [Kosmotoga pacifica]AKI97010.1 hypothetical protein IX53_03305 [Kosmotoga pacifica]